MPDIMHPPAAPADSEFLPLGRIKFNTADAIDRQRYGLAHSLKELQTAGCKSFFAIGHINVPGGNVRCAEPFGFQRFVHGVDGGADDGKTCQFFQGGSIGTCKAAKQRQRQVDAGTSKGKRILPECMQDAGNIVLLADGQNPYGKGFVILCRQIFFPQDQSRGVCLAHPLNLIQKWMRCQMPVADRENWKI